MVLSGSDGEVIVLLVVVVVVLVEVVGMVYWWSMVRQLLIVEMDEVEVKGYHGTTLIARPACSSKCNIRAASW
jgi:uncharacterized membrane protein YqiK